MPKMEFPDFAALSGPELVDQFNAMLEWPAAKLLAEGRYRTVSRFADRTAGVKRCEALASSLRAVLTVKDDEEPAPKSRREKAPTVKRADLGCMSRPESKRQLAINCLLAAHGQPVALERIVGVVYGPTATVAEFKGPISMVLNGIKVANVAKKGLPYRLVKTKNEDKEIFFALEKQG